MYWHVKHLFCGELSRCRKLCFIKVSSVPSLKLTNASRLSSRQHEMPHCSKDYNTFVFKKELVSGCPIQCFLFGSVTPFVLCSILRESQNLDFRVQLEQWDRSLQKKWFFSRFMYGLFEQLRIKKSYMEEHSTTNFEPFKNCSASSGLAWLYNLSVSWTRSHVLLCFKICFGFFKNTWYQTAHVSKSLGRFAFSMQLHQMILVLYTVFWLFTFIFRKESTKSHSRFHIYVYALSVQNYTFA